MLKEPKFTRKNIADILGVTTLTIANREKAGKYPDPKRDLNNYRIYSLKDVMNLQRLTFGSIDNRPILSVLYDKGFKDPKVVAKLIDAIENKVGGNA